MGRNGDNLGLQRRGIQESVKSTRKESVFNSFFLLFILESGGGREKGRERNTDQLPLAHTPVGDQTRSRGTCPDQELSRLPFTLREDARPTGWCRPVRVKPGGLCAGLMAFSKHECLSAWPSLSLGCAALPSDISTVCPFCRHVSPALTSPRPHCHSELAAWLPLGLSGLGSDICADGPSRTFEFLPHCCCPSSPMAPAPVPHRARAIHLSLCPFWWLRCSSLEACLSCAASLPPFCSFCTRPPP